MHVVFIAFKVLAQAAFAVFVPGGGIIVALNLYRKYRKAQQQPLQQPVKLAVVQDAPIDPPSRPQA